MGFASFTQNKPAEWTLLQQENGVDVYFKYSFCQPRMGFDKELVLFRFINTTATDLNAEWDNETYRGSECTTCKSSDEYHYKIRLQSNSSLEGDCSIECDYRLRVFSEFRDAGYKKEQKPLTKFELANFNVTNCK
jgi:hypothetical protein